MRTGFELIDESGNDERIRELGEFFLALQAEGGVDHRLAVALAPRWLRDAFAPERSSDEGEAWLAQWRTAADKLSFERESGWTAANWFHWFSPNNEFWKLGGVRIDEGGHRLVAYLDHVDDPIPVEVLRWLAIVGNLQVGSMVRVQ